MGASRILAVGSSKPDVQQVAAVTYTSSACHSLFL